MARSAHQVPAYGVPRTDVPISRGSLSDAEPREYVVEEIVR